MSETGNMQLGDRELDILQVLWKLGNATVTEVQIDLLQQGHKVAYTTVQTMLNRLELKGHVKRDGSDRAHRYAPLLEEPATVGGAIQRIVDRFFNGSMEALAVHLVEKNLKPKQLKRIEALLEAQRRKEGAK